MVDNEVTGKWSGLKFVIGCDDESLVREMGVIARHEE
jgi:hypothetical protein